MGRFFTSLLVALFLAFGLGLYLGWVQFPQQVTDSPASTLAQRHKDDYTAMIAAGYAADGDLTGAIERLRLLNVTDVPTYIVEVTERQIANSGNLNDIRDLVVIAEALGQFTDPMAPYRQVERPTS